MPVKEINAGAFTKLNCYWFSGINNDASGSTAGPDRFLCTVCAKSYKLKQRLVEHERLEHSGDAKYVCSMCNKKYMRRYLYDAHVNKHQKTKRFQCSDCKCWYRYKVNLNKHQCRSRDEGPIKSFVCGTCGSKFIDVYQLRDHEKGKHVQTLPYSCKCGKAFRWRSSLFYHRKSCKSM